MCNLGWWFIEPLSSIRWFRTSVYRGQSWVIKTFPINFSSYWLIFRMKNFKVINRKTSWMGNQSRFLVWNKSRLGNFFLLVSSKKKNVRARNTPERKSNLTFCLWVSWVINNSYEIESSTSIIIIATRSSSNVIIQLGFTFVYVDMSVDAAWLTLLMRCESSSES